MKARLKKGFTLVEVIIVLVIIGIVAAFAVPGVTSYITRAGNRSCEKLMQGTMDDIGRAVVTQKFPSNAAVSIDIYKAVNNLPILRLRCPLSVGEATETELDKLERGPLTGAPLEVKISTFKSTVEGEKYIVNWSFSKSNYVTVTMSCMTHEDVSISGKYRIYYGGDISDIVSPPGLTELRNMYSIAEQLLDADDENGQRILTVGEDGATVTGDFAKAAGKLSLLCGKEVKQIHIFRLSEGRPLRLYFTYTDMTAESYDFSPLFDSE